MSISKIYCTISLRAETYMDYRVNWYNDDGDRKYLFLYTIIMDIQFSSGIIITSTMFPWYLSFINCQDT